MRIYRHVLIRVCFWRRMVLRHAFSLFRFSEKPSSGYHRMAVLSTASRADRHEVTPSLRYYCLKYKRRHGIVNHAGREAAGAAQSWRRVFRAS